MREEDRNSRFDPAEVKSQLDEQLTAIDEVRSDLKRNVSDLINETDPRNVDFPEDIPSSQEDLITQVVDRYSDLMPTTSTMTSAGAMIGGLLGGPAGAILLGSAGAGVGLWKDLDEDRMVLSLVVNEAPTNIEPVDYSNDTIQRTGPLKYTIKFSVETDMDMGRIRNTLSKTHNFDEIERSMEELPTTTLQSTDFPDVCYVSYKDSVVAVWIEDEIQN